MVAVGALTNSSAPEEEIALFRSFFRGREDVYPRRFENRKMGKSGYPPACANEWVRGVYRRNRHKDALLQQHGYFVLRFLACDLARRLDPVLDAILAVLQNRKNSRRKV